MKLRDSQLLKDRCYIGGKWVSSNRQNDQSGDSPRHTSVINPSTQQLVGTVPNLGANEASEAVTCAHAAFVEWKETTAEKKSQVLKAWYEQIIEHTDDLATILTSEQGKPFNEARGEIAYAASFVLWYSEEAKRAYGETIPSHKPDGRILVTKQPIGVVAAITPWNFPAAMITRKCAPAFAAGCAVVLKPAPETPLTALALAELAHRAGIPAGLFNVITGDALAIGGELTSNKLVRKVSFTGSTHVGKILMNQSASSIKKMALELGGNAPFIVFDDADIDAAVEGAMIAKFRNAGQTCVCANRLYIHDSVYDEFTQKLTDRVKQLVVGDGFESGVDIGPLINQQAVRKVASHLNDALNKGAVQHCGEITEECLFVQPIVLSEMSDEMLVANEETFGPMAPIFRFSDEDEVIQRANNSDSGLAAYVYTASLGRAWRMGEALETGMVGINEGLISTAAAPFGGVKESGLGREGSKFGLDEFMELKYLFMGGLDK
ncbi:NAD-dependent succinate-semialdehyde dehydrogenase [Vibrio agarivorans]|uniref:NAD-dependent succinate-semialdehyde dehydrogenase n=1 Tax=Vibrio agarivorans TaxID=153622 RepID=UPI0025B5EA42|nr:NAD-dependent succinate-semialdehyde dehydrogenase [Vibrio agarivorans]MDN3663396.1 NAD-dependent succinate-semialdehyde dehydrogenase [Vibrio agarivorans]